MTDADRTRRVLLIRHGQTAWSLSNQHTGRTDIDLTPRGEQDAAALAGLADRIGLCRPYVIASPRRRAQRTAELAGLHVDETSELFAEWDYGDYEGLTRLEIQRDHEPGWTIWTHGARGGESVADMTRRVDAAVDHVEARLPESDVIVVSHGHFSRSFICRFLGWPITQGAAVDLRPAGSALLAEPDGDRRLSELRGPEGYWASAASI
ncbi:histidine phosphatase family protein [Gordonia sp. NB41Y]|uniref:histidine phosphatase family protein n=1 Tax=Gordonia sp. NB41Y TaxID=875808 RepID=UPI0002BF2126|nr:histidine phosphatase family protein [Gordonia sp. NB41Y]EMP10465.1 acid phosphatase [Gordonia sp. NB41Y]WLP91678.1 histidine phosphatase family protein [Gordonia sp. NB41Y]